MNTMEKIDDLLADLPPMVAIAMLNTCISVQAERIRESEKDYGKRLEALSCELEAAIHG